MENVSRASLATPRSRSAINRGARAVTHNNKCRDALAQAIIERGTDEDRKKVEREIEVARRVVRDMAGSSGDACSGGSSGGDTSISQESVSAMTMAVQTLGLFNGFEWQASPGVLTMVLESA